MTWLDDADLVIAADGGAASLDRVGRRARRPRRRPRLDRSTARRAVRGRRAPASSATRSTRRRPTPSSPSRWRSEPAGSRWSCSARWAERGSITSWPTCSCSPTPALAGRDVRAVRGGRECASVRAGERLDLDGSTGELVTLLPVGGDAVGVTTDGLRWPLDGATLRIGRSRGSRTRCRRRAGIGSDHQRHAARRRDSIRRRTRMTTTNPPNAWRMVDVVVAAAWPLPSASCSWPGMPSTRPPCRSSLSCRPRRRSCTGLAPPRSARRPDRPPPRRRRSSAVSSRRRSRSCSDHRTASTH